jgi:hypothetical protein
LSAVAERRREDTREARALPSSRVEGPLDRCADPAPKGVVLNRVLLLEYKNIQIYAVSGNTHYTHSPIRSTMLKEDLQPRRHAVFNGLVIWHDLDALRLCGDPHRGVPLATGHHIASS